MHSHALSCTDMHFHALSRTLIRSETSWNEFRLLLLFGSSPFEITSCFFASRAMSSIEKEGIEKEGIEKEGEEGIEKEGEKEGENECIEKQGHEKDGPNVEDEVFLAKVKSAENLIMILYSENPRHFTKCP